MVRQDGQGYILKNVETERNIMRFIIAVGPPLYYLNKHRKVLLSSTMAQKSSSYYNPQANKLGYSEANRMHHYKEIVVRGILGSFAGYITALAVYGNAKAKVVDPELAKNP